MPELPLGGLLGFIQQEVPPVSEGIHTAGDNAGRDPLWGLPCWSQGLDMV